MPVAKLNILCLHREIIQPGGSETFMYSIIKALHFLGHKVSFFTLKHSNYISNFLPFCKVVSDEKSLYGRNFDAVFSMHRPMVPIARKVYGHKTMISNGILPISLALEGFDRYVSVSEEVYIANKSLGFLSDIIFNGIDLHDFQAYKSVNRRLENVLMITNHFPGVTNIVQDACRMMDLNFIHIGGMYWTLKVCDAINNSDLVVSLGRGAYEAMACERNVIVFDYRGGDGFVTPGSVPVFRARNFSGRVCQFKYNAKQFCNQLLLYDPTFGPGLRDQMIANHNIHNVVKKLLKPVYKIRSAKNEVRNRRQSNLSRASKRRKKI